MTGTLANLGLSLKTRIAAITILLLMLSTFAALAQPTHFSIDRNYGYLWPHKNELNALQKGPYSGFEIRAGKVLQTQGWHLLYRLPELGLSYSLHNPGYPEVIGYGHALSAYLRVPFFCHPDFQMLYSLNFGLGYLTKKFNIDNNYYNIAIGSHFNVFGRLSGDIRYRVYKNMYLKAGISLSHFSNTSIAKPNLGINLVSGNLGIEYDIDGPPAPSLELHPLKKYWELNGIIAWSTKEITPPGARKYFTQSIIINLERRLSWKHQLGIGYDLFFDGSLKDQMDKADFATGGFGDYIRNGLHVSYGLMYGRVLFNIQFGSYLFEKFLPDGNIYNRLGLRAYLKNGWIINISLKSHYGRADFAEFGIGHVLTTSKNSNTKIRLSGF